LRLRLAADTFRGALPVRVGGASQHSAAGGFHTYRRVSARGPGRYSAARPRHPRAPGDYSMATRMLIDARHPEETRVAVLKGNRIEEFDFESAEHKQIKGNIYLAKVTRVEPSLQAAFCDFGGNRHGF